MNINDEKFMKRAIEVSQKAIEHEDAERTEFLKSLSATYEK